MRKLFLMVLMMTGAVGMAAAGMKADTTALREGDRCPAFRFRDAEGKEHTLEEFRGSYVLIDVWASWCYPCRKEYPHLQELERRMEGKNVVFVGISCDQAEFRWKGMLPMMGGTQWWIAGNEAFMKTFGVNGIPRFILLDRRGRVLRLEMSRPSKADTEPYLRALPGIDKTKKNRNVKK